LHDLSGAGEALGVRVPYLADEVLCVAPLLSALEVTSYLEAGKVVPFR